MEADYWIKNLGMEKHPEGGYFHQTVESDLSYEFDSHSAKRKLFTSIYFLLKSEDKSHLHRLKSDEVWYFHAGSSLTVHVINERGEYRQEKLGLDLLNGEKPQVLVEKGSIFGSTVDRQDTYALVGCMVAPGFDFADFELFSQAELTARYPEHEQLIQKLALKNTR